MKKYLVMLLALVMVSMPTVADWNTSQPVPQSNITRKKKTEKKTEQQKPIKKKTTPNNSGNKNKQVPVVRNVETKFSCNVQSATLYIDGQNRGRIGSSMLISLKPGQHTVRLTATDHEEFTKTITVSNNNKNFSFSMKAMPKQEQAKPTPAPTPTPTPAKVTASNQTFTANGVSFTMVYVKGGTFTMGATSEQTEADDDEKPTHNVTLSDYYIGQTEVTQQLWQAVMGNNPSRFTGDSRRPVEQVSWDDCQNFIRELNRITGQKFHLPTEAQWEYAARGGSKSSHTKYSGSHNIGNVAWYDGNSGNTTHPVATKQANELGIYDMSGNVWEWCADWYGTYGNNAQTNPTGPTSGQGRVLRGGGWFSGARICRSSNRYGFDPSFRDDDNGLRLAL